MKKVKCITLFFIVLALLLVIPNVSNAATEYTYSDTEQGIEWSYQLDSSNNVIELKCKTTSKTGEVTIPSTIDGKTVISLKGDYNNGTFYNCAGITSVTIPNTIAIIGEYAFGHCTGLKSITLPDSVTKIESGAFYSCSGITSVTLSNNLTSIGQLAFYGCSGLKSLTIPNSVTTIGEGAFRYCSGLKELSLSENLTKITDKSFEGCSGLTSVILPDSVTTIEGGYTNIYGAFGDCKNLAKILIPDSVASIGEGAFQGCDKLTIYGNDGMTSKEYAETKEIPFDYIANWDKENSGADITAPTVENIQVTYASVMNYSKDANKNMYMVPAGAKLVINVNFSEVVEGTTVPTLTIKFGDGENIKVTEGTVGGTTITYIYTVKNTDKGVMTTIDLSGGNVKDAAGNAATLSCPAVSIQYNSGDFVYANGTATNPDNGDNNNNPSTDDSNKPNDNNPSTDDSNKPNDNNPPADDSNKPNDNNPPADDSNKTNDNNSSADDSNKPNDNNPPADNSNKPNDNNPPADDSNKPTDTTTKPDTSKKEDNTTATGKLPQTGLTMGMTLAIIAVFACGVFAYFKYSKLRGI